MEDLSSNLARNIRRSRDVLGISQQRAAQLAGIPRPTWANLESGQANPTIAVLLRVSDALCVPIEELLRPKLASARVVSAESLPVRRRGKVAVRSLLPEPTPGLEIERLTLPPKAQLVLEPRASGAHQYCTCEVGEIEVNVGGEPYSARSGDVVVFRADQAHGFRNIGRTAAVVYCVLRGALPQTPSLT